MAMTARTRALDIRLPDELEFETYRSAHADLALYSDPDLAIHYRQHGESEGRRTNSIVNRTEFAALIPPEADALEIGPFHSPLLHGERTKYFDVMPQADLIERAQSLAIPSDNVPPIDYVSPDGDLNIVDEQFDCVLSSHSIEHQPDLITHLRNVEKRLRPGGRYFVLAPDKRYCFDHFIAESTLADVLQAHHEKRVRHTLKSLIEHRVLVTHNYGGRHWTNDHGGYMDDCVARTVAALDEYTRAGDAYLDVHAWYFTPHNARLIFPALTNLNFTGLHLERLYPTRYGANEFWFVLQKAVPAS